MACDSVALWTIMTPLLGAVIVLTVGRSYRLAREPVAVAISAVTLCVSIAIALTVFGLDGRVLSYGTGGFWALRIDALSALFLCLVNLLLIVVVTYSVPHIRALVTAGKIADERVALFYSLTLVFAATMNWACATDNIIVLFLAVEATTLASALLVTFYWNKRALEAGYKYLLLLTVGITFGGIIISLC